MDWLSTIGGVLQRYTGDQQDEAQADRDFDEVSRHAPQDDVADGIAGAFRSDRTPPFPDMLSNLFSHSNGEQRAGILNSLLGAAGPGMLSSIPGLSGLSGLFGGGRVDPEQAQRVPPEAVREMAAKAEQSNPSIVDQVSRFYAQHPDVVKALGGAALAVMMGHIAQRRR